MNSQYAKSEFFYSEHNSQNLLIHFNSTLNILYLWLWSISSHQLLISFTMILISTLSLSEKNIIPWHVTLHLSWNVRIVAKMLSKILLESDGKKCCFHFFYTFLVSYSGIFLVPISGPNQFVLFQATFVIRIFN